MAFLARSRLAIAWATLAAASLASSSSAQVTTSYTYDPQGQVKTVVRSGNTIAYTYDAAGNRTAVGVSYPPPGAAAGSMSVPFGGSGGLALPVSGQFTGAAVDTVPTKGSVTISGTTATYTASGSNYGSDSFTYHAVGPGGNSPVQTIGVTIANPPAPGANNGTLNVAYNSAASLAAPVTGVATGLVIDSNPAKGSVTTSGTTGTYTATWPNYGSDSFTYHATGPGGASPVRTMSVNIANGRAPTASNGSAASAYNAPVTITYPVSGDYAVAALDSQPAHGSVSAPTYVNGVGSQSTYTPQAGWIGADSWTFHGTSGFGNSPARTFTVTTGAPAAPTVANKTLSVAYGTGGSVSIAPSGVYTSVAILTQPAHGQAGNAGNQTIADYIPAAGYYGSDSFTYNATGPGGTSAAATVSVTVATPPAPTAGAVSASIPYNTAANIALAPGGVSTTYALVSQPAHGTPTLKGGYLVLYNPATGYSGPDSFTYVVNGPGGQSAPGAVSITVAAPPVAPAPVLQPDSATVHSRNTVVISPLANDSDPSGYPLTITNVVSNGGGTPTIVNGATQINFIAPTVATRANKTVTLTYTVSNGHGGTASSTISVVVATEYFDYRRG